MPIAAAVAVLVALVVFGLAMHGGAADWSAWSIIPLAALAALNRANMRSWVPGKQNTLTAIATRAVIAFPFMLVFVGAIFFLARWVSSPAVGTATAPGV